MDKWLRNNNVLKVLSFVLALMLWMVVQLDTTVPSRTENQIINTNTYYYEANVFAIYDETDNVINMERDRVNITLKGTKELINAIRDGQNLDKAQFFVDLSNYKPGSYTVPIKHSGFPKELGIQIQPSEIKVNIEAKYRKEMIVVIDKLGTEAEGYQTGDPIVKPKKIHISGTKEQVEKVVFVKAFINVDDARAPILEQIPLRAFDKNGYVMDNIEITPQTVEVQVPVTSPYVSVPITFKIENYPPSGYAIVSIEQLTKEITLYGPKDLLLQYDVYEGPVIDLSNIQESQVLDIKIPLDEGIIKIVPDTVQFQVTIAEATSKTISQIPIELNGLNEELSAEVITPLEGANIIIEGAQEGLDDIKKEDLQAFVNLANLPPGEHEVPILYNIPITIKITGGDETAKVKIIKE